jgi:pimeloyl-ACP methyl ester carboxylesterase
MRLALLLLATALAAATPALAAKETFVEIAGPLKGTQLAPDSGAKAPAAIILPGSGPTDRDGDSPLGVKASTYRLLAESLAAQGVTTVRIDKRGQFASGGAATDGDRVMIADLAADANAWAADLKRRIGAPCVWLIGHSEGALVAEVAAQSGKDLCGLVLVSGAGRKFGDVLRAQLKANPANAPIVPQALAAIDTLEAGHDVDTTGMNPGLLPLFGAPVQPLVRALLSYDPAALLKAYKGPALIVQGTTDLQIGLVDAERLKAAKPDAALVTLDGVNHVLKVAPASRPANIATYADPSLPLAPGVAEAIADFLKARR